jgi:short-subunit dehydrogenase
MDWLWLLGSCVLYVILMKLLAWSRYSPLKPGSTVLVTGGCQGLGRQIALQYARAGCRVVIWDIDEQLFSGIQSEIEAFKVECIVDKVNVVDRSLVTHAAAKLRAQGIKVDLLVNNAGIAVLKPATELTEAEFRRVMDVNYFGVIWATLEFLPEVAQIGFVASVCSYLASGDCPEYIASKFAVNGFIQSLRQELKAKGSQVVLTTLYPYHINTKLFNAYKPKAIMNLVISTLKEEDVGKAMFDAVSSKREEVFVPEYARVLCFLFAILPTSVRDWLQVTLSSGTMSNAGRPKVPTKVVS